MASPPIGRSADLDRLLALLAAGERFVTITGPGGIGKSRLLDALAARAEDEVVRVDLDDAASEDAFLDAVAVASHASAGSGPEGIEAVLLGRGPTLLVLDPLDRVLPVGPVLLRWLEAAPQLGIACASREPPRAAGQRVYELGPLGLGPDADAVALLVAAVRADRHDYAPDPAERALLAEIARELEGVPLALELAASRLSILGPAALLHRLRSRFEILRRPGAGRQDALEASIAWSWETLEPHERTALAASTVFRGGFGPEAAEAVLDLGPGAPPVLDVLESLRRKSLLRAHDAPGLRGERRFSLDGTVRAFAARSVGSSAPLLEARHALHHVAEAERWAPRTEGRDGAEARRRLLLERENLLSIVERVLGHGPVSARTAELALRALVALHPVLSVQGPLEVYAAHLERALAVTAGSGADPRLQAAGLFVRGITRRQRGQSVGAERDLGEALALASHTGDRALEARALLGACRLAEERGQLDETERGVARAREQAAAAADRPGEVRAGIARASLLFLRGERAGARAALEKALLDAREIGSVLIEAMARRRLAWLELEGMRLGEGRAHATAALELAALLGDLRGSAVAGALVALADQLDGRAAAAAEGYRAARAELGEAGFGRLEALAGAGLGLGLATQGEPTEARFLVEAARRKLAGVAPWLEVALACAAARLAADPALAAEALRAGELRLTAAPDPTLAALVAGDVPAAGRGALPALLGGLARPSRSVPPDALRIGPGGGWFRAPGGGHVDLGRRRPLRLILARLADERERAPGSALPWHALLDAGWPGEKMRADAGAHRVRVAVSTLRKLGLRDGLRTVDEGYVLDPALPLARAAAP